MFIERLNIVSMSIIFNLLYRFQKILIKIPSYFVDIVTPFLKFIQKYERPKNSQHITEKKRKTIKSEYDTNQTKDLL